jgi:hypothetical protein
MSLCTLVAPVGFNSSFVVAALCSWVLLLLLLLLSNLAILSGRALILRGAH